MDSESDDDDDLADNFANLVDEFGSSDDSSSDNSGEGSGTSIAAAECQPEEGEAQPGRQPEPERHEPEEEFVPPAGVMQFAPTHCPWMGIIQEEATSLAGAEGGENGAVAANSEVYWYAATRLYLGGGSARRVLELYGRAADSRSAEQPPPQEGEEVRWAHSVAGQRAFYERLLRHPVAERWPPSPELVAKVAKALVKACSVDPRAEIYEPLLKAAAVTGTARCASGSSSGGSSATVVGAAANEHGHRCFTFGGPVPGEGGEGGTTIGLLAAPSGTISVGGGSETSMALWQSGLLLADFLLTSPAAAEILHAVTQVGQVLELGTGCGTVGIALAAGLASTLEQDGAATAAAGRPIEIVMTDNVQDGLLNCATNCLANGLVVTRVSSTRVGRLEESQRDGAAAAAGAVKCCVELLDWAEVGRAGGNGLPNGLADRPALTLLLGADLVYDPDAAALLATLVRRWLLADPALDPARPAGGGGGGGGSMGQDGQARPRRRREFVLGTEMRNPQTWAGFLAQITGSAPGALMETAAKNGVVVEYEYLAASEKCADGNAIAQVYIVRFVARLPGQLERGTASS